MSKPTTLWMAGFFMCACITLPAAAQSCGLDRRNAKNVALPSVAEQDLDRFTLIELNRAFALLTTANQAGQAGPVFERVLARSTANGNLCAQALAQFGLADWHTSESLDTSAAEDRIAQTLFATIGTPLAKAIVAERIAVLEHLTGNAGPLEAQAALIEQQLRDAGDPASAIRLHSLTLQYAQNGQKPEEMAALAHELESVRTENATAVRGYIEWAWGSSLRRVGRYAEIQSHFQSALAAFAQCDCEPGIHAALLLNMAAAADSTGNPDVVLRYATEADDIYRSYSLTATRPQAMRLIAAAYSRQHNWPKAIAEYHAGLELAGRIHVVSAIPNLTIELAAADGDSGDPRGGLDALHSLTVGRLTPMERCAASAQEVQLDDQASDFADAVNIAQPALKGCDELLQPNTLVGVEAALADSQIHRGNAADAVTHARHAVAILDTQRARTRPADAARIEYNDHQTAIYTVLIRALIAAGLPEDALLASEQGRARAFVDLAETSQPTVAPSEVRGRPALEAHSRIPAQGLPSETHTFSMTAADLHHVIDQQHSTLIAYWLGNDRLFTWVVAPGRAVIERDRPVAPRQLAALVRASLPAAVTGTSRGAQVQTRGGESQSVAARSRKPWSDLYNLLIAPIASDIPAQTGSLLTIIPQGALFQVSFPALLDPHRRYLIERYAIHEAPSVAVLQIAEKNAAANATAAPQYVVVANPEKLPVVDGVSLPPLPGTAEEASSIKHLVGAGAIMLEGRQAGIESLKAALPAATVLHFATHSVVDDAMPSTSFLALDARQDGGRLTTSAVYGLHLHTSLVVLSACRSGRGQITGDGVQGFARAFLYAGSASLVTTLWDVVDVPTARLVPTLYLGLVRGEPASSALRDAQLHLIRELRTHRVRVPTLSGTTVSLPEDPAYWAAFSLSGES